MAERRKRRNVVDEAIVGDLVVALDAGVVTAIEEVTEEVTAQNILDRWRDQGLVDKQTLTEVWESMPSFYFRRRRLERKRRG